MKRYVLLLMSALAATGATDQQTIEKEKNQIPSLHIGPNIQKIEGRSNIAAIGGPLKGYRYDYKDGSFKGSEDGISGSQPTILINFKNGKAIYVIKDTSEEVHKSELEILDVTDEWISFFGKVNGAPTLISLYLPQSILYISQHSTLNLPGSNIPKAQLFYSKCQVSYTE